MHSLYSPYQTYFHKVQRAESQAKNRSSLGTREKKVMFDSESRKDLKVSKNLFDDLETLNKAVAISALVEKP